MPDITTQYRILVEGAGRIGRSDRAALRLGGADRVSFLQALVSNDLAALESGHGVYATWLTPQGRMITDLRVYARPDGLLLDVPSELAGELAERLDQLIFAEDVQVADASAGLALVTVLGAGAAAVVSRVAVEPVIAAPVDDLAMPAFDVWIPAAEVDSLTRDLDEAGVAQISPELFEAMRIEAGRPRFGVDMTTDTIPLEAGLLDRAISTSKGCYVGQEVIIRVLHRGGGRVARRLVRLAFDPVSGELPPAGAALIFSEGKETGRLTSVARSPDGERGIALAYVRREVADAGGTVQIETPAGRLEASIIGLAG